jgi:hypothetical protein
MDEAINQVDIPKKSEMVEMRPSQRPSQNQSDSWWRIYDGMSGVHLRDTLGHLFTDCDMDNDGLLN